MKIENVKGINAVRMQSDNYRHRGRTKTRHKYIPAIQCPGGRIVLTGRPFYTSGR